MTPSLSPADYQSLTPLLIVLCTALLVLLVESFFEKESSKWSFWITLFGIIAAIIAIPFTPRSQNPLLTSWLIFDHLSTLFTFFFLAVALACTLLANAFFHRFNASHGEYYFLLLAATFGLILIGYSADFLTLFLGIETLSIALYILCGYMKKWKISHESAIKYFLMGSIASAFLLYGIALIYGAVGTTRFADLLVSYQNLAPGTHKMLFLTGAALVTISFAFKGAIVPFHVWAPDVYEGASTPVTAFMAVGTKIGAFVAFIRVFLIALPKFDGFWNEGIAILSYATLIYANYVALRQAQLRRFFAYSGISHAGFLLIPLAASTQDSISAMLFYIAVYAIATLGCFAVMAFLDQRNEGVVLNDLYGLFKRSPTLAVVMSLCLLTLAGLPPTLGFFAKFYIFKVAFEAHYYGLVIIGLLTTILSAFYYLRFVTVMFSEAPKEARPPAIPWAAAVVCAVAMLFITVLSFYPEPLLAWLTVS